MSAAEELSFAEEPADALSRKNPFKFLQYYKESDADIFAGRGEELTNVLAYFALDPTFVLYGRSGLGKTSILRAGLFPRLIAIGYLPIYVRILDDPEAELCAAVAEYLGQACAGPDELPAMLANVPPRPGSDIPVTPVVLVLDQFEEFFIRFRKEEGLRKRKRFAELLSAISKEGGPAVRIVFSLREDHVAELEELRPYLPDILNRSHRLLPLTAVGTREAILATLDREEVPYDLNVPGEIVKVLEKRGFNPLELQIYCSEVFEAARVRAREKGLPAIRLEREDLARVGSIEQVYVKYLDGVTRELTPDRALLACCILDILRTAENTKRAVRVTEIAIDGVADPDLPVSFTVTAADAADMLRYLCDRQVVRQLPTKEEWYELLHDGIVPVLTEWLQRHERFRAFRDADRLIENLRTIGDFLTERQLRIRIDPYRTLLRLTRDEMEFLLRSSVYEGAESVAYWAERYDAAVGPGAADAIVREAIGSAEYALPGLKSAGRTRSPVLAPVCFDKALSDMKRDVRRAAGEAYAEIDAVDTAALKSALRRPRTRRKAIELVADLLMRGRDVRGVNRFVRWRANRLVAKRRVDSGAGVIRSRSSAGYLGGLAGVILWMLFIALPGIYVLTGIQDPSTHFDALAAGMFAFGILMLPYALWNCRRIVARVALESVVEQREWWSDKALAPPELQLAWLGVGWTMVTAVYLDRKAAGDTRWLAELIIGALLVVLAGIAIVRAWRTFRERRAHREATINAAVYLLALGASIVAYLFESDVAIVAIGGTLLARALIGPATRLVQRALDLPYSGFTETVTRGVQAGYLVGVLPFMVVGSWELTTEHLFLDASAVVLTAATVLTIHVPLNAFALSWAQKLYPLAGEDIPVQEQQSSRGVRAALLAGIPATILFFFAAYGSDFVPLLSRFHRYEPGQPIVRELSSMWPGTHHVQVAPRESGVFLGSVRKEGPLDAGVLARGLPAEGQFAMTRRAPLGLAITNQLSGSPSFRRGGRTTIVVDAVRVGGVAGDLSKGDVQAIVPALCTEDGTIIAIGPAPGGLAPAKRLMSVARAVVSEDALFLLEAPGTAEGLAPLSSKSAIRLASDAIALPTSAENGRFQGSYFGQMRLCAHLKGKKIALLTTFRAVDKATKP